MRISRDSSIVVLLYSCMLIIAGCAAVTEGVKGVAGISTRSLEKARKHAVVKTLPYDYFTCYTRTEDILKEINAYIYSQSVKKHMIAVYVSEEDTTPVGIFFKELDADHTQVEFSSLSTYAKEFMADRVTAAFNETTKLQQGKDKSNVPKEVPAQ